MASHCVSTSAPQFGNKHQTPLPLASGTQSGPTHSTGSLQGDLRKGIVNQKVGFVKGFCKCGVKPAFGRAVE